MNLSRRLSLGDLGQMMQLPTGLAENRSAAGDGLRHPGDGTGHPPRLPEAFPGPRASMPPPGGPVATVLLAEPQATARQVREREFVQAGFAVSSITNSGELVRWLLQMDPDVLVLDRRMAGEACELVEWMREHPQLRRTVCYVMALVPNLEDRRLFLEAGADWYIDKNALINPLPTVVRAALDPAALGALPPQRLAQRFSVKVPVEFMHGRRVTVGESLNISQTGMFLRTPTPLETGGQTLVGFTLPGHRRWETFARVVWTRHPGEEAPSPPGMGLHFLDLEPDARAELDVFLMAHAAGAAGAVV